MDGPQYFPSYWQSMAILIPIQRKIWFIGITICLSPRTVLVYTCCSDIIIVSPPLTLKIVHNQINISLVILAMRL